MRAHFFSAFVLLLMIPVSASARVPLIEEEEMELTLSGYLKTMSALQHLTYEGSELIPLPSEMATDASVMRAEWNLNLGEHFTFDVHQRLFWSLQSEAENPLATSMGVGASPTPSRTLDLSTELVEGDGLRLSHDIDRLTVRLFTEFADITLGRQAVTWGDARLFTVNDIWTSFSPFELDLSEKRGVDGIRFISSLGDQLELEALIIDRDDLEDLSGGLKATLYLESADLFIAASKSWRALHLHSGIAKQLDTSTLRAEFNWSAFHLDEEEVQLPRATLGYDWYGDELSLTGELHFNGLGAGDGDYLARVGDEDLAHGENYWLGRYYAGAMALWEATDLLSVALSAMGNLTDPSMVLAPSLTYRIGNDTEVIAGGYFGVGETPELGTPPAPVFDLKSEFGAYGHLYFVQLATYL